MARFDVTCGIESGGGVIRHRGVPDGSDRARPLWRRHSARTEMFFADVDHLEVLLQSGLTTASRCNSKFARSQPWSASLSSHDHSLQVHLRIRSITAYIRISKLARSRPPSVSWKLLDHGFEVRTSMPSKCISKLAQSRPVSTSPHSPDHSLQG